MLKNVGRTQNVVTQMTQMAQISYFCNENDDTDY